MPLCTRTFFGAGSPPACAGGLEDAKLWRVLGGQRNRVDAAAEKQVRGTQTQQENECTASTSYELHNASSKHTGKLWQPAAFSDRLRLVHGIKLECNSAACLPYRPRA